MWLFSWVWKCFQDNLAEYKYLFCNKYHSNKLDEKLKNRFINTFKFSNNDTNKLILLLRKSVYLYEYMYDLEKVNETILSKAKEFCSNLNIK